MSEQDDQKIGDLLKKSPTLTPPESFYRGVLEKIERKDTPAEAPAPWYWGYPAKGLATACVLAVIVLVTRETKTSKPELFRQEPEMGAKKSVHKMTVNENAPVAAPASAPLPDLSNTKEVQSRVNNSIAGYLKNPSPFEEVDEAARKDLARSRRFQSKNVRAAQPSLQARAAVVTEARDTLDGAATQGSFQQEQKALAKQKTPAAFGGALAGRREVGVVSQLADQNVAAASPMEVSDKKGDLGTEWSGASSGIDKFRTVAVQTTEEWGYLWQEHMRFSIARSMAPPVDFNDFMVIGVFAGARPTAGYSIAITQVNQLPDKVMILYRETTPTVGMSTAQVVTQPYHLRLIPKTSLPITFQKIQ